MTRDSSYFSVDDATYAYEVQGHGKPVLLLHGFTGSGSTWETVIDHWKHQFMFITIDLPGHGKTVVKSPRTMESFSADLVEFLEYIKLEDVHVIGYSLGGRTALNFAMLYPDRVSTLILESASPGLENETDRTKRRLHDNQLAEKVIQNGLKWFVDYWESVPLFQTQKTLPHAIKRSIRQERLSHTEKGLAQSLQYMGTGVQPSWWDTLSALHVPTLLITGSEDKKFIETNLKMKQALPNAKYAEVEHSGHAIHVEQPEIFGKLVVSFINAN
ncbi:2-succinyl-6-hydroxy-2,4-cyclohexadiene-1-carboxylate synthase [Virgibacillus sp. W0181]|uniref:2-succinyl-6-hydroxy-2, 4-cyclohexadiene-1-carboxylate synthase n=1 Tax=Virgibacillus sp. W0181 TaxID=3391581 RepID=UPI003F461D11